MTATVSMPVGIERIQALLPHRYPFLLVDRVVEFEPGKRILAWKNVTGNEPFFQGHFPGHPVMPGVLVLEALAQTGGLLTQLSREAAGTPVSETMSYLVKIDAAKFSRMIVPGDRIELEVALKRVIRNMAMYVGTARVDGETAACAEILCAEARD
ncbi:3-hydroxyacyl-ACP dehydratase FabZ [Pseudoluteimonas lycopersici]|jgi:3-hydroxyacyl-[acyl-carrier-protein] dehydratase|uniref:3-hydroxyacyl-[acyl-carrier-protein] dehydratase FabZ n=1 Tax=Pseudoluteimonas lycopersici TaxID=1324796 RepID=A0A516V417_9GAMM|nr:3-hydroxyacyl-ACP dehydratase FabZ [Lysobacter lycopersici]QDQ73275.1 3-hydroxyacyl-ACP dehydratase FabZ [Lysobacter lycopersici]